jgi:hypothetical protein
MTSAPDRLRAWSQRKRRFKYGAEAHLVNAK